MEEKQQVIHQASQMVQKAVPDAAFYPASVGTLWASFIGIVPELTALVVLVVAILKGLAAWEEYLYKRSKRLKKD